jgi:hypothetical protein
LKGTHLLPCPACSPVWCGDDSLLLARVHPMPKIGFSSNGAWGIVIFGRKQQNPIIFFFRSV